MRKLTIRKDQKMGEFQTQLEFYTFLRLEIHKKGVK